MAIASYGTIRPSDCSPDDMEIILNYTPSRDVTSNFVLKKLDAKTLLRPYFSNQQVGGSPVEILGGLYNLTLPATEFNALGIYTMLIRPAQIRTSIIDCGVLSALPNVKGIVLDLSLIPQEYRNKFVPQLDKHWDFLLFSKEFCIIQYSVVVFPLSNDNAKFLINLFLASLRTMKSISS